MHALYEKWQHERNIGWQIDEDLCQHPNTSTNSLHLSSPYVNKRVGAGTHTGKTGNKHRRILPPEFLLKEALSAHIPVFIQGCLKKLWLHVGWIPCIDNKCIWQCSVVYFKVTKVLMHVLSRKPVFTASWYSQNLKVMIITACMRFYFPNKGTAGFLS